MKIAVGSDHGGFELKQQLTASLTAAGHEVADLGANQLQPEDDYPVMAVAVAQHVAKGQSEVGILLCRSGQGMCMAANKVAGVRAAACQSAEQARLARAHNHANVLCLGADEVRPEIVPDLVQKFITTPWDLADRHVRRVAQIQALD